MIVFNKSMKMEFVVLAAMLLLSTISQVGGAAVTAVMLYLLFKNAPVLNKALTSEPSEAERAQMYIVSTHLLFAAIIACLSIIPGAAVLNLFFTLGIAAVYAGLAMDVSAIQQKLSHWILDKEREIGVPDHASQQKLITTLLAAVRSFVSASGWVLASGVVCILGLILASGGQLSTLDVFQNAAQFTKPGPILLGMLLCVLALPVLTVSLILSIIAQFKILGRLRVAPLVFKFSETSSLSNAAHEVYLTALFPFLVLFACTVILGGTFLLSMPFLIILVLLAGQSILLTVSLVLVGCVFFLGIPTYGYYKMRQRLLRTEALMKEIILNPTR